VTFVFFGRDLLTKGQGEFPSLHQYNLGMERIGEGGRGRNEGYGKWVELADLPILHMTLPKCEFTAEQYHIFIFAVFDV